MLAVGLPNEKCDLKIKPTFYNNNADHIKKLDKNGSDVHLINIWSDRTHKQVSSKPTS